MARYLLDTTTLIDFSKGVEPVTTRMLALIDAGEEVGVCAVTVAEFVAGLPLADRQRWRRFLAALIYWDMTMEAATRAGEDRYDFARRGIQIATADALIAATARAYGAILIADNVRHFPMADVVLLSLR